MKNIIKDMILNYNNNQPTIIILITLSFFVVHTQQYANILPGV